MNIGWLVLSRIRTAVRRLCGHVSGFPNGVADQLKARVNAPICPPPARKSELDFWMLNIGVIGRKFSLTSSRTQLPVTSLPNSRLAGTFQNLWAGREQNRSLLREPEAVDFAAPVGPSFYFIRPAAVSARVMIAPTSIPRRDLGGGSGRSLRPAISGQSTPVMSGAGAGGGVIIGAVLAGAFAVEACGAASLGECIRSVRPKKLAM